MESSQSSAAKLLQARLGQRRKLTVFLCLALAMVLVTVAALVLHAQAMNYTRRVLECAYEPHEHTLEECGEPDARTCGLADYVVHVHNDDCYNVDGELACPLPEEKPHTHDESCLVERKVLICEEEGITEEQAAALAAEAAPAPEAVLAEGEPEHVHTEECYTPGERVLGCGQEEREAHTHTEACYAPGERVLGCGQEEREAHTHTEACYAPGERVLACGQQEQPGHTHGDGCYTPGAPALSCGQEEQPGHAHTDACYADGAPALACGQEEQPGHTHTDACYVNGEPTLVCGKGDAAPAPADATVPEVPQHVHTEECYETVTELGCGKLELHTHTEECYTTIEPENPEDEPIQVLTCTIPQLEEHVHGEECFATVELSPDEVAALKAQEMGIELHDLQTVYEDANVRVTVDYDTLSLVPQPAEVQLVNANIPQPEPTPNPLLPVPAAPENAGEPEAAQPGAAEPTAAPAPENTEPAAPENINEPTDIAPAGAPATEQPIASACGGSNDPDIVRAGLMAEGREWLPAATVIYTVQYLENGQPVGEPAQYAYTPGGELPVFPRGIARYYRECRTEQFVVTASYTALANIPEQAELRASPITDEQQVAAYESAYKEALNTSKAQMLSLLDIGFWLDEEEIQPAAPVSITVQMLGEDGLPAGEPISVVHFAEGGAEVLPASVDESGAATFDMNSFSLVALGFTPEADEEGRVMMDHTFSWTDESGLFQVQFYIKGIAGPYPEAADANAPAGAAGAAGAPGTAGAEDNNETDAPAGADVPRANDAYLNFTVETLGKDDAAYAAYAEYAAGEADAAKLLNLAVMRYALTYGDVAMDLSGCEIEVTITPTEKMELTAAAYRLENPGDNGDADGDGYVTAADGETMLPAPETEAAVLFSAITPAAQSETPVSEQGTLEVGGEEYAQQLEGMDTAVLAEAVFSQQEAAGEGAAEEDAAQQELSAAAVPGAPAPQQGITFTMPPEAEVAPQMARTFAARTTTDTNPMFTVQYYAVLQRAQLSAVSGEPGANDLPFIDTNGKHLPKNRTGYSITPTKNPLRFVQVYPVGHANAGQVITNLSPVEVYSSKQFDYLHAPELIYTNLLVANGHYADDELWILKPGKDSASMNAEDWYIYQNLQKALKEEITADGIPFTLYSYTAVDKSTNQTVNLSFTNNNHDFSGPSLDVESGITYIPLNQNSVVRWVYKASEAHQNISAVFYDYDISRSVEELDNGKTFLFSTNAENGSYPGINGAKREGTGALFAFGNANCGTGLDGQNWQGNIINASNGHPTSVKGANSYRGCAFGMVTGINPEKNNVVFASGISAPTNLFGPGSANGKHQYGGNLTFIQDGDTFTLSKASVTNVGTIENLNRFCNPNIYDGISNEKTIWTNSFWPMDNVKNRTDRNFGKGIRGKTALDKNELGIFNSKSKKDDGSYQNTLPVSDDAIAHNSFFGMYYQVSFKLVKEYIGPLEYYFYGDDDMWVFLDDTLVCDIGGVHSSVGEYVNLWDYLEKGSEGEHTLTFFYTERGASGSTCWMQFTLPNVSSIEPSVTPDQYGDLRVEKTVTKYINNGADDGETKEESVDNGDAFKFKITFTAPGGQTLPDYYQYSIRETKTDKVQIEDVVLFNNGVFSLKNNQYILIEDLPQGTTYTITEIDTESLNHTHYTYDTDIFVNGVQKVTGEQDWQHKTVTGTIGGSQKAEVVKFNNNYHVFGLPETGNAATPEVYALCGGALALASIVILHKRRKRARV